MAVKEQERRAAAIAETGENASAGGFLPANAGLDLLACWRDWGTDLRGSPVASGHYLPEENPAATAQALLDFFNLGT